MDYGSITILQTENILDSQPESSGNLQSQECRRNELPTLNGIYCLPAHSCSIGQLLLCHTHLGAGNPDSILHNLLLFLHAIYYSGKLP